MRPPQLEVRWAGRWRDLRASVRTLFRAFPIRHHRAALAAFRTDLVRSGWPYRALVVSAGLHGLFLVTPLPEWVTRPAGLPADVNVTRIEYDLRWSGGPVRLPAIAPAPPAEEEAEEEPAPAPRREEPPVSRTEAESAQTIVSEPPEPNHPRQTLLTEFGLDRARVRPPEVHLPNMVIPPAAASDPRLQLDLNRLNIEGETVRPNLKSPQELALEQTRLENLYPKLALTARHEAGAAPQVDDPAAPPGGKPAAPGIIALSAQPGPLRPILELPDETLQARFTTGPAPGAGSGAGATDEAGGLEAPDIQVTSAGPAPKGPVVVGPVSGSELSGSRVSPPVEPAAPKAPDRAKQQNEPPPPLDSIDEETAKKRAEQLVKEGVRPGTPTGSAPARRRVYTIYINMPNLGSQSGSWVLRFAELGQAGRSAPGGAAEAHPLEAPVALKKVDPRYPAQARREEIEGIVFLYGVIRADGTVENVEVVRSVHDLLDESAAQAFRRWRFQPGRKNGFPVDLEVVVEIPFRLSKLF